MKLTYLLPALVLVACAPAPEHALQGYGEAQYTYVSSEESGRIVDLATKEGDRVEAGALLFRLDPARQGFVMEGARAQSQAAQSRVARSGALAEAERAAQANASLAQATYQRTKALYEKGFVAKARLDIDAAALRVAQANASQAQAERRASADQSGAATADVRLAERRMQDMNVAAPVAGRVERIYRRKGEVVSAGTPVLALIADGGMKIRFFAPEAKLSSLHPGDTVGIGCDGCAPGGKAHITYVASEPQFTPPVIYSLDERRKLLFLVEATPDAPQSIRPGLPVDVTLTK